MAKTRTAFFCQSCGTQSPKWIGKCPSCGEWNSFVEEVLQRDVGATSHALRKPHNVPKPVNELDTTLASRIELKDQELNRVLGGGLVPGSLILFGGEPGIGKSTLMLQLALRETELSVLYVSGEESEDQIRMRAERLGLINPRCLVLMESSLAQILGHLEDIRPGLVIIDSIQTLQSELVESFPGSVSQVRECATRLLHYAKENQVPVFLIGHITKEGSLAGPKVLEHMVDCVLQFEGDRQHLYRILRTPKNRFGSTHELGIYEMHGGGLRIVENPSEILVREDSQSLSGSAIAAALEGMRPLMIEIQALASTAVYGTPQRSTTGFDIRRLNMLLAVLEKRCGFRLAMKDVFLNIAGGMRMEDPAMDLAVISAVLSSSEDLPIPRATCFAGEVGLSGEVRPVPRIEQRIQEASRLGFERMFVARPVRGELPRVQGMEVVPVSRVDQFFSDLFG
ncbi:MAG: DNA repair protein RadA [Flavobacteriales bacterium]|jgi:DNA repair protein RadA/Sms